MSPHGSNTRICASFRDPAGRLVEFGGRILRIVSGASWEFHQTAVESPAIKAALGRGEWVGTRVVPEAEAAELLQEDQLAQIASTMECPVLLEHERIWFPTYPYEWTRSMLADAARLTLQLASAVLDDGLMLKDATPFNVLFRGCSPIWVDVTSLEAREPRNPIWLACGQFNRTFLLPLLACRVLGLRLDQIFLSRRDGLEPEFVYAGASWIRRLTPPVFGAATVPALLGKSKRSDNPETFSAKHASSPAEADFVLRRLMKGLQGQLRSVGTRRGGHSVWAEYAVTTHSADYHERRSRFVQEVLLELRPKRVLDIGCNTGRYSRLAARSGAEVVGIDSDEEALEALWAESRAHKLSVVPCMVNIARPTPATGWRNGECKSLLERVKGQFDGVLMLAVLHHLIVTERVPMREISILAGEITKDWLLIEFVSPEDELFKRLARGRDLLHQDVSMDSFEAVFSSLFVIEKRVTTMENRRWLYLLRKKGAAA
jgi:2-polyprenyl-3-methyl-5-hydroxy-6-metoxy-1,4-benzoquinol methylase